MERVRRKRDSRVVSMDCKLPIDQLETVTIADIEAAVAVPS